MQKKPGTWTCEGVHYELSLVARQAAGRPADTNCLRARGVDCPLGWCAHDEDATAEPKVCSLKCAVQIAGAASRVVFFYICLDTINNYRCATVAGIAQNPNCSYITFGGCPPVHSRMQLPVVSRIVNA